MTDSMDKVRLVVGAGIIERVIPDAEQALKIYKKITDYTYLDYLPVTPRDLVVPEDLAVTLALNSRVGSKAVESLMEKRSISLAGLPDKPLEAADDNDLEAAADQIMVLVGLKGFGASVASKLLHKKRPALIPVMDNSAIFGAYMNPDWPQKKAGSDTVKDRKLILEALRRIRFDITRPENEGVWARLGKDREMRSRIELFDCVWWGWFKQKTRNSYQERMDKEGRIE
ncbi:MAG TPA: DUF6308 family protein [Anaerolineaceae bacterium]|nr:DUF6308 family protein [Anaerolineaceae bacterium]